MRRFCVVTPAFAVDRYRLLFLLDEEDRNGSPFVEYPAGNGLCIARAHGLMRHVVSTDTVPEIWGFVG